MLSLEALQERINNSELGQEWINNPLLNQDIWSVEKLGYTSEESKIQGTRNIHFEEFSSPWLKLLAKLTTLTIAREKYRLGTLCQRVIHLRQFDKFLIREGCSQPELLTDSLLNKFVTSGSKGARKNRQLTIAYVIKLWAEEQWLRLSYTPHKYKRGTPKIEVIPEEVLLQFYENFDLFPPPLERLFRLQLVLGCRIGEILTIPRQCLKKEGNHWFLLRWVQKRQHWQFYQIHSAVANLVREQQKFLDAQIEPDSDFDKLFCKASTASSDGASNCRRFDTEPIYLPELLSNTVISAWLRDFREKVNLKDKHGKRFELTSHQFRRTKASIMAYCEAEDEYIAAVLGHGSLDMLPHYRKRSLERLEKEANTKGYVDSWTVRSSCSVKKYREKRHPYTQGVRNVRY